MRTWITLPLSHSIIMPSDKRDVYMYKPYTTFIRLSLKLQLFLGIVRCIGKDYTVIIHVG